MARLMRVILDRDVCALLGAILVTMAVFDLDMPLGPWWRSAAFLVGVAMLWRAMR